MNGVKNISKKEINSQNYSDSQLSKKLEQFQKKQFSGCLSVTSTRGYLWKIYFCMGRLIWADGGIHPNRSWRRHLVVYCPEIKEEHLSIKTEKGWDSKTYEMLATYLQKKLVDRQQALALIKNKIHETLFDILQQEAYQNLPYNEIALESSQSLAIMLKKPIALVNSQEAIEKSQNSWSAWVQKGLGFWSPSLAPQIIKPESLAKLVPQQSYENLVKLVDGKKNLRDLSCVMKRDILKVAAYFIPYVHKGFIKFIEIKDVIGPVKAAINNNKPKIASQRKVNLTGPLIISIDDRPEISKLVGRILENAGYRFIGINDNLNAVAKIIDTDPNLIFLDVDMPVINGYEICSQIRRVPKLKNTPIVMLTGHSGIIDKARAKMVGATGFMTKPIESEDIIGSVKKFLQQAETA